MTLKIPRSLDSPWLEDDPKLRSQLIEAYRKWLWEHIEIDRLAAEQGLDGGECPYGFIDPKDIAPDLPLNPEWVWDDGSEEDPTRKTSQQFYELTWKVQDADLRELFGSSKPHYLVLARAIKWMNKKTEKQA